LIASLNNMEIEEHRKNCEKGNMSKQKLRKIG